MKIRLVVTGRAYHHAAELPEVLDLPDNATLDDALEKIDALLPADVSLPSSCLISIAGNHVGTVGGRPSRRLCDGDELTLVSPVAGG